MAHPLPFRRLSVLLFGSLALALAGCGGKHSVSTVTGKVTVAGTNPLPGGNITFYLISDPSQVAGAVIKSDGTFEVVNAPVGECKVVVDNTNLDDPKSTGMPTSGGGMPMAGGVMTQMGKGTATPPPSGPPSNVKEKMNNTTAPKGVELDPAMTASKDTGAKKYVKIDPAFTKVETTTLRHTVTRGGESSVTFDVK